MPNLLFKSAVETWFVFYHHHTKETYIFSGKDGFHLKQLLKKIELKVKEKGMEPTEDNILNSLKGFLNSIKDPWILDHLEISLINSKFNIIYATAIRDSPFQAAQRINNIVEDRYGTPKPAANGSN